LAGTLTFFVTKPEQEVDMIDRERLGFGPLELFPQTKTDTPGDHLVGRGRHLPIVRPVKPTRHVPSQLLSACGEAGDIWLMAG
jgi:hypothetical protein